MAKRFSRSIGVTSLALGLGWLVLAWGLSPASAGGPHVGVLRIDGAIDAISARYLSRAIGKATDDGAVLIVLELDTPGGRLDSTRDMVEEILGSPVPLAVYVSPSGPLCAGGLDPAGDYVVRDADGDGEHGALMRITS